MKPTEKSPAIDNLMSYLAGGKKRGGGVCMMCPSTLMSPSDFNDDVSRKEASISGMCQKCQDKIFGE